jgi:hypothetical protein
MQRGLYRWLLRPAPPAEVLLSPAETLPAPCLYLPLPAANPPHVQLASTHLRNTLLGMHGWEVVSVPFNHWAKLEGQQEKQEYLKKHVLSKLERGKKSQSGAQ